MDCYFYYHFIILLFVLYIFVFAFYFQLSTENQKPQDPTAIDSATKSEPGDPSDIVVVVVEEDHNQNLLCEKLTSNKDDKDCGEEEKEDDHQLYLCASNSQSCGSITTMTLKNNHLTIETEETNVRLSLLLVLLC